MVLIRMYKTISTRPLRGRIGAAREAGSVQGIAWRLPRASEMAMGRGPSTASARAERAQLIARAQLNPLYVECCVLPALN